MLLRRLLTGALIAGCVGLAFAQAQGPAAPVAARVATVNGEPIGLGLFELVLQERLMAGVVDSPALRDAIRRDLIVQAVLAQEAEKASLDQSTAFRTKALATRKRLLAEAWQQQWIQVNPPTEQELTEEYEATLRRAGRKEYRIRQVVLRDETAARLVLQQVRQGKSLADMAREYSVEPLGKSEGGLLPWVTVADLVEPLGQVVADLKIGQIVSEPVRSSNGWHILQVEADRPYVPPVAAQIRPQLVQAVIQRRLRAAAQDLVNKSRIELR